MIPRHWFRFLLSLLVGFSLSGGEIYGKGDFITIRRDAEIESTLKDFIVPLFKVAHLDPKNLRFFIVVSPEINAAAAAGSMIFLNTGFLLATKSAGQAIGVLAHETGHIAGGHSARFEESIRNNGLAMAAMMALGITGGLAAGKADVAMAGVLGSLQLGERSFLHYSRTQEWAADQAGIKYLQQLGWPTNGAIDFMRSLERQESLNEPINPYLRTHPLWEERIRAFEHWRNDQGKSLPKDFEPRFERIRAKLYASTYSLKETLKHYKGSEFKDLYAQAIAHHVSGHLPKALELIQDLLEKEPRNPFLWEMKGSIFLDIGHQEEAKKSYKKAIALFPENGLLRISLARILLDGEKTSLVPEALSHLKEALKTEEMNPLLWHTLAIAYGRQGDMGQMALCLAEEALLNGEKEKAMKQAKRSLKFLKPGTHAHLRAKDIELDLENVSKPSSF